MNSHQACERILVVDDEQAILDLLKQVLGREGYQVITTHSSEEVVVGLMSVERFDLAVVDVGFRSLNGCTVLEMVREISPETAIVAMVGYPVAEVINLVQEHAQGYLEKPFDLQELLTVVRSALKGAVMHGSKACPAKTI